MNPRLSLAAALALGLAACASPPEPRTVYERPAIQDTDWRLVGQPGRAASQPLPASGAGAVVLRFEADRFSINGPCNRHGGEWRWTGEQLQLGGDTGAIASTKRGCPSELMQREQALLAALRRPLQVERSGPFLQLVDADGGQWRFDAREVPPAEGRELIVHVAGQRAPCTGVAPMLCLQVRTSPGAPWQLHYGEIEGFAFQPGVEAVLRVKELPVAQPAADASSLRWVLVEVLERGRP